MASLGVHLANARSTVEYILGRNEKFAGGHLALSPRARQVIRFAQAEAGSLDQDRVGPEHLLLGIVREGQGIPRHLGKGIAAGVIETLGVDLEPVRLDVLRRIIG